MHQPIEAHQGNLTLANFVATLIELSNTTINVERCRRQVRHRCGNMHGNRLIGFMKPYECIWIKPMLSLERDLASVMHHDHK